MFTKEHEGLVYQFLYLSIAIAFLALVATGIHVADSLWNVFENQEEAKDLMQEYAEFAAYNGTTVRGQELINLAMKTKGDPYLVVVHKGAPNVLVYSEVTADLTLPDIAGTMLGGAKISTIPDNAISYSTTSITGDEITTQNLQQHLQLPNGTDAAEEGADVPEYYRMYSMTLVLSEDDNSVIGVIAKEVPSSGST